MQAMNGVRFEVQADYLHAPKLDIVWVPGGDPDALVAMMRNPDRAVFQVSASGRGGCDMGVLGVRRRAAARARGPARRA